MSKRVLLLIGAGLASLAVLGAFAGGCTSTNAGGAQAVALADTPAPEQANTLDMRHLGLSTGPLRTATLADLPDDLLLRAGEVSITRPQLDAEIERQAGEAGAPAEQLRNSPFFLLENLAIEALLTAEARAWAAKSGQDAQGEAPIDTYLQSIADVVTVTDAEVRAFFDENPEMFDGASYEQVAEQLQGYVLSNQQQSAVEEHIASLSARQSVEVDAAFAAEAAQTELANPVDEARRAGRPVMVDFGAEGCGPCDMMTPIIAELQTELADTCSVLFVPVREEQILAARYGIRSIPVQVFFDAEGREVFRHTGFFSKEQILSQLAEMGVG